MSRYVLITTGRIETYQIATYTIRTLLKTDYWSPKHAELLNVMNKINHQILCILLDHIYIAKWWHGPYSIKTLSFLSRIPYHHHSHVCPVAIHLPLPSALAFTLKLFLTNTAHNMPPQRNNYTISALFSTASTSAPRSSTDIHTQTKPTFRNVYHRRHRAAMEHFTHHV